MSAFPQNNMGVAATPMGPCALRCCAQGQVPAYLRAHIQTPLALLGPLMSKTCKPGELLAMLAIIAAILFAVAFILHVTSTATDVVFSTTSLALVGLVLLALHQAGMGPGYSFTGRRKR